MAQSKARTDTAYPLIAATGMILRLGLPRHKWRGKRAA